MKFNIFFSVFVISISLYACNSNNISSNNENEQTPVNDAEPHKVEIKGQAVFEQKCAACHGSDGTAVIGNAANLKVSKLDSVSIARTIEDGKGGMPSFASQLTQEEIAGIASYVLALRK